MIQAKSLVRYLSFLILIPLLINCQSSNKSDIRSAYEKREYKIEMRDGVKLFTSVYSPRDKSVKYPILMIRTPYSINPYGEERYTNFLGASKEFADEKFIFVFQDVRGRFLSEGEYDNMRPYIKNKNSGQVDESSDTYDSIDWLIKNIDNNNGKVGLWGSSYPGFYALMGSIDAHPNLICASPQAPISDWFIGDDMHHNGAFTLLMAFNFFKTFGIPRKELTNTWTEAVKYDSPDAYNFFIDHTPIKKLNEQILKHKIPFWDTLMAHGTYDYYWKARSNLQYLKNIKPALLIVGGWYDAEDLYGPLNIYKTIEKNDSPNKSMIVMGPWTHGAWINTKGDSLGDFYFGSNTADYYRKNILLPFFRYYLKDKGEMNLKDAYMFDTGANLWNSFSTWPPENTKVVKYFLRGDEKLNNEISNERFTYSEYLSDPFNPVPYTNKIQDSKVFYNRLHLIEDQRYASTRPDVLTFETEPLNEKITIAGPIAADLFVSTTDTDADLVVKVIDVYPDNQPDSNPNPTAVEMGGYERLVRTEIFRGKFRNSFEKPEPFVPDKIENIKFNLNDAYHTFKEGHKIMVQIQSSFFPFFDVNPNTFCDIYNADKEKFVTAKIKIYHSYEYSSSISFKVLDQ